MTTPTPLFRSYKEILDTKGLDDELYKWRAVQHFQENYDEAAENFGEMFLNAISKHTNLIDRWQWPFINELAKLNSEGMRSLITELYDESVDIEQRVKRFQEQHKILAKELEDHPDHDPQKTLKQEERTISVYLGFRYPEKYPFYKYSFYQKTCEVLGEPISKPWKRLIHYYQLAKGIRNDLIETHQDIVDQVRKSCTEDSFQGDDSWIIVQDLLYQTLDKFPAVPNSDKIKPDRQRQYWLISPGEQAVLWKNAKDEGVIRIGWDYTGDLSEYESEADLRNALIESDGRQGSRKNDVRACWDFSKKIQIGDIVIAKQGRNKLLGWGEVTSDYEYNETYDNFNHARKVDWKKTGEWKANEIPIPLKTLTDWTSYPEHIENIRNIIWETGSSPDTPYRKLTEVGYFLARRGVDGPPVELGVGNWQDAFLFFHDALGAEQPASNFRNSLKGFRDAFDGYFENSRMGYRNKASADFPRELSSLARIVFDELSQLNDQQLWERVRSYTHTPKARRDFFDPATLPEPNIPHNLILYGPPGTGKTYTLSSELFPLFSDIEASQTQEEFTNEMVASLSWWEVITVVMLDLKTANVGKILEHPVCQSKVSLSDNKNPRAAIWAQLQSHTKNDCPNVNYTKRLEPLLFWKDENSSWSLDLELTSELVPQATEMLDLWKRGPSSDTQQKRYVFTTFHQSYSYEDFIEGIRPVLSQDGEAETSEISYEVRPGVFKEIAKRAALNPNKPYAIFIDEINRGNIASVFGELITLIEDDKRSGADSELEVTLPYSRERFSVPSNLYIIGTMNTADRSVESLDTALRRRFSFKEMLPEPESIPNPVIDGIDVKRLLRTINERLELLLDKDHTIGHAFFWSCQSIRDLRRAFANKIIPLLEEFFYNDTAKIGMVLGPNFVKLKQQNVKLATGPWDNDGVEEGDVFQIADIATLSSEAFKSVYEAQ